MAITGAALVAASFWLAGCSSTGYKKSDSAAGSMQDAAAEVQAQSHALEITMGALRDLVNDPPANLPLQYRHYSDALDRLAIAAKRTQATGKRMDHKSEAYFLTWTRQLADLNYEHVRELSQARLTEVTNRFDAVHHRYQDTQAVVEPLIAYLNDIRKALETDLTTEGVASLQTVVRTADQNAAKVQTALSALTAELTISGTRLSSIALQTAVPPQGAQASQNRTP